VVSFISRCRSRYEVDLAVSVVDTDMSASYLDLHLEIKDTTDTDSSASYLDLHIEIQDTTDTDRFASYLDLHLEIKDTCGILYFKV
jgi:hypothetical protein